MITQNQFPFNGMGASNNQFFKALGIGLLIAGALTGLYFTVKAIDKKNKAKIIGS